MDAAQPDFAANDGTVRSPGEFQPSSLRWLWAPLALGAAITLIGVMLQQLRLTLLYLLLGIPFIYAHQAQLNMVAELLAPALAVIAVAAVALRAPGVEYRAAAITRLACALALQIGIVWLAPVAVNLLTGGGSQTVENPRAYPLSAQVGGGVTGFLLGATVAIALAALTPPIAARGWPARLGYWALVGALAECAAAVVTLLQPVVLITVTDLRLAAIGVNGCVAGSGAGCYGPDLLRQAQRIVPWTPAGAVIGAVIVGFLAPHLMTGATRSSAPPVASEPDEGVATPRGRRARRAAVARALVGGLVGALYFALVIGLIYLLARSHITPPAPDSLLRWSAVLGIFSLVAPACLIALVVARVRLTRALRWTLTVVAAALAVAAPLPGALSQSLVFGQDISMIILIAFSFGAVYGFIGLTAPRSAPDSARWRPGARSAVTGWLGVSLPVAILISLTLYSMLTYSPSPNDCHGLGCGALFFVVYTGVIWEGVAIIIYGLMAAAVGGGLAGALVEASRTP